VASGKLNAGGRDDLPTETQDLPKGSPDEQVAPPEEIAKEAGTTLRDLQPNRELLRLGHAFLNTCKPFHSARASLDPMVSSWSTNVKTKELASESTHQFSGR